MAGDAAPAHASDDTTTTARADATTRPRAAGSGQASPAAIAQASSAATAQCNGPRTVVKSRHVFACLEPLGDPFSCLKKQNSCAKNRSTPLDRFSEPIPCEVLAKFCSGEHKSGLTRTYDSACEQSHRCFSASLSFKKGGVHTSHAASLYERRCIYPRFWRPFWKNAGLAEPKSGLQIFCSLQNTQKQTCS